MYDLLMYTTRLRINADRGSSKEWKVPIVLWWLFLTLNLLCELQLKRILATGTFRANRIGYYPLPLKKSLTKEGGATWYYRTEPNIGNHFVQCCDNKCILIGSNYAGVTRLSKLKCFGSKSKTFIEINCPDIIMEYNRLIGDVDLVDMLIELLEQLS